MSGNNQQNGQNGRDDGDISRAQTDKLAKDVFEKSLNALTNADFDKTTKVLGFLEVPTGVVAAINSGYNVISQFAGQYIRPKTQALVLKHGNKLGLEGTQLTRAAALATIGTDLAVKGGNYFGGVWNAYKERKQAYAKLATSLTPILDDLKGKHTVGALGSVSAAQNEVIYAQRKRIARITGAKTSNSWIDFAVNAAPNMLMDAGEWGGMWKGEDLRAIRAKANQKKIEALQNGTASDHSALGEIKHIGRIAANTSTGQIAGYFKGYNDHKLNKTTQPYSAFEMIVELERQVAGKPDARSFTLPKSFGAAGRGGESVPLEEYVMRIILQHSRDMAGLDPDYTEIREALRDDVAAAAKPLAEAIRKGEMSAMELVHLVGEGKIIKNHGRAIASPDEVEAAIVRDEPKQIAYAHVESKNYWGKKVSFSQKEAKEALQALTGDERQEFLALIPPNIRKDMGVSEKESKEVDAAMMKRHDRIIAEGILGLGKQSDEQLEKMLAKKEIAQERKAEEMVEKKGEAAAHALKEGPTNDNGIEPILVSAAVSQIIHGDKTYFGKMMADGHARFETLAHHAANDDAAQDKSKEHGAKEPKTFAKQFANDFDVANDHGSHAGRAQERRMTGTHDHHRAQD